MNNLHMPPLPFFKLIKRDIPFADWKFNSELVIIFDAPSSVAFRAETHKDDETPILIISCNHDKYGVIGNVWPGPTPVAVEMMNNKAAFAFYMMNRHGENIPRTFYVHKGVEAAAIPLSSIPITSPGHVFSAGGIFYSAAPSGTLLIEKPIINSGGIGVCHVNKIELKSGIIVQEYIQHKRYYVGHFLVNMGVIVKRVYFKSGENKNMRLIKRGGIKEYEVMEELLGIDDNIFVEIFEELGYSGFACCDFIEQDGKIIIFEINPRLGGSLANNGNMMDSFLLAAASIKYAV